MTTIPWGDDLLAHRLSQKQRTKQQSEQTRQQTSLLGSIPFPMDSSLGAPKQTPSNAYSYPCIPRKLSGRDPCSLTTPVPRPAQSILPKWAQDTRRASFATIFATSKNVHLPRSYRSSLQPSSFGPGSCGLPRLQHSSAAAGSPHWNPPLRCGHAVLVAAAPTTTIRQRCRSSCWPASRVATSASAPAVGRLAAAHGARRGRRLLRLPG